MAALGRREIAKKNPPVPAEEMTMGIAIPPVNLGVVPAVISPIVTLGVPPSFLGGPIMREDFITTTGFMPPRID
jgi:hypothetical protein